MTPLEIEEELLTLADQLFKANEQVIESEREYSREKCVFEARFDSVFLEGKTNAIDKTIKELEADARLKTNPDKINLIEKEAKVKHLKNSAETVDKKISILQSIIKLRSSEMRAGL